MAQLCNTFPVKMLMRNFTDKNPSAGLSIKVKLVGQSGRDALKISELESVLYFRHAPQEIWPLKWAEIAFRILYEIFSRREKVKKHPLRRRQSLPELLKSAKRTEGTGERFGPPIHM